MKYNILKKHFGYETFRIGQEEIIDHIMDNKDVLGIMPTGGGKSICYQIPAMLKEGITIVVSPLIALMKDQVDGLIENGIPSTFINSTLSYKETSKRLNDALQGEYKLLYVAPERLLTESFKNIAGLMDIMFVAVDEAHCISQWGHDFRPSYKDIPVFINSLKKRPVIGAYTATATKRVVAEIKILLGLDNPYELLSGFNRENLIYRVIKPIDKYRYIKKYIENQENNSGIIYCSTRKSVESLATKLQKDGFSAAGYHGGMDSLIRTNVQESFMYDNNNIIVATNAFGMGIDKPDVRYVIHYNMPKNMESYYQEAGRAGRDGKESDCILMYSPSDVVKQKLLIGQNAFDETRLKIQFENLQYLVNYCHSDSCLRNEITEYFGEKGHMDNCRSCGNCLDETDFVDMTIEAQKIMSLIYRSGQRFGLSLMIQTLRGSKNKRVIEWRLDEQSTYDSLKDYSEGALREIIMNLIARGYIHMTTDKFPVLRLTNLSKPVLIGDEKIMVKKDRKEIEDKKSKKKKPSKSKASSKSGKTLEYDEELYELLAQKRKEIGTTKKVPLYIIFSNATLEEIAFYKPKTKEEFLEINGAGEKKYSTYGEVFMQIVKEFNL